MLSKAYIWVRDFRSLVFLILFLTPFVRSIGMAGEMPDARHRWLAEGPFENQVTIMTADKLATTPPWIAANEWPPISPKQAIDIARRELPKLSPNVPLAVQRLSLWYGETCDRWYWMVGFAERDNLRPPPIQRKEVVFMGVYMDGMAVIPTAFKERAAHSQSLGNIGTSPDGKCLSIASGYFSPPVRTRVCQDEIKTTMPWDADRTDCPPLSARAALILGDKFCAATFDPKDRKLRTANMILQYMPCEDRWFWLLHYPEPMFGRISRRVNGRPMFESYSDGNVFVAVLMDGRLTVDVVVDTAAHHDFGPFPSEQSRPVPSDDP